MIAAKGWCTWARNTVHPHHETVSASATCFFHLSSTSMSATTALSTAHINILQQHSARQFFSTEIHNTSHSVRSLLSRHFVACAAATAATGYVIRQPPLHCSQLQLDRIRRLTYERHTSQGRTYCKPGSSLGVGPPLSSPSFP
jgi:hypothetical protein